MCQVGVEINLGHHGNPCPSRNTLYEAAATTNNSPSAAVSSNEDVDGNYSDNDGWEDDIDDEDSGDYGLPKLKGEDACVVMDKSGVHRI
jgi:hypothetical protein